MDDRGPVNRFPTEDAIIVNGRVKWFNQLRGFGFIVSDQVPDDIMFHQTCLKPLGLTTADMGAAVQVEVVKAQGRFRAKRLIELKNGIKLDSNGVARQRSDPSVVPQGPMVSVQVRWFSRPKGYGFLTRDGSKDIFVHMELLRKHGIKELRPSQTVLARYIPTERGLSATYIKLMGPDVAVPPGPEDVLEAQA